MSGRRERVCVCLRRGGYNEIKRHSAVRKRKQRDLRGRRRRRRLLGNKHIIILHADDG